jgi:hypothetical protein
MKRSAFRLLALLLVISGLALAQQPVNNAQVAGAATATAASGVQKVGIVGVAGTTLDGATAGVLDANVKNINNVTPLMGNGVTGPGSQRVTIASDNTAFSVNATLSAETTKVIGTVNVSAAQTIAVTNTGTFAAQATLSAETTKVIGTVRNVGNVGGIFDTTPGATAAANSVLGGGVYNSSLPTPSTGQQEPLQLDASGKLLVNCTGCSSGSTISLIPATSGGLSISHLVAAASNNATSLKGSAGQLYGASVYNNASYPVYLKFCNKATACTCGTNTSSDTILYTVAAQAGTEREIHTEEGIAFGTGIGYCVVKGMVDTDNTSLVASDAVVDLLYK